METEGIEKGVLAPATNRFRFSQLKDSRGVPATSVLVPDPQALGMQPFPVGRPNEAADHISGVAPNENMKRKGVCLAENGYVEVAHPYVDALSLDFALLGV